MNRDFSRITVIHVSGKDALKQRHSKTSQLSVQKSRLPNATEAMNNSKQKKMNHQGQENAVSAQAKKEINQSNLIDCPRDSLPINSITNSTTCFDLSNTHRSFSRHHRISPINCRDLLEGDFSFDIDGKYVEELFTEVLVNNIIHRNRNKRKNQKKLKLILCKICLCALISLLLIGGLIGVLIYLLSRQSSKRILILVRHFYIHYYLEYLGSVTTTASSSKCFCMISYLRLRNSF